MSLTSYRAAPPRVTEKSERSDEKDLQPRPGKSIGRGRAREADNKSRPSPSGLSIVRLIAQFRGL